MGLTLKRIDDDKAMLLTVQQAANELAMSRKSVDRLIQTGALPSVRLRGCVRIDPADIAVMIHTHKVKNGEKKVATCHSTSAEMSGGCVSPHQAGEKYAKLLQLPTGARRRNTMTAAKPISGE